MLQLNCQRLSHLSPQKLTLLSTHPSVAQRAMNVGKSSVRPNLKSARLRTQLVKPSVKPKDTMPSQSTSMLGGISSTSSQSTEPTELTHVDPSLTLSQSTEPPDVAQPFTLSQSTEPQNVDPSIHSQVMLSQMSPTTVGPKSSQGVDTLDVGTTDNTQGIDSPMSSSIIDPLEVPCVESSPSTKSMSLIKSKPPKSSQPVEPQEVDSSITTPYMRSQISTTIADPPTLSSEERSKLKWSHIVSPSQESWMRSELRTMGLHPGTPEYRDASRWEGQSLWRTPPLGELQKRSPNELPRPDAFWIHPMFVWAPELMFKHLLGVNGLPCKRPDCSGSAERKGIGRPRVVVGSGGGYSGMPDTGQYYIFASELYCKKCKCSPWQADLPAYLCMLPEWLQNIFPAHVAYNKAVCKQLVDKIRRSGRSCADIANEVKDLLQARYERAHQQYLLMVQHVKKSANSNLDTTVGFDVEEESTPFGSYSCLHGWRGVNVSEQFVADILIVEYNQQRPYLYGMMRGVFGRCWRSDHTRTLAKKVQLKTGVMWSYSTLNEFWEVVSWVMVDADTEKAVMNYYNGLRRRYDLSKVALAEVTWVDRWCCTSDVTISLKKGPLSHSSAQGTGKAEVDDEDWSEWMKGSERPAEIVASSSHATGVIPAVNRKKFERRSAARICYNEEMIELLDTFHCIRRFGRACVSEAHPAYSRFMSLLSCAFFIIDEGDLTALKSAREHLKLDGEPSKKEVRRHCRTVIPPPHELQKRVEAVLQSFLRVCDASGERLFTPRMLNEWYLQRTHIQRGCLSDPIGI